MANYTSLTGSFASTSLPTGYTLDYDYQGNSQIALVAVPEPGQLLLGGFGLAALGGWLSADGGLRAAIAEGCLLGVRHPAAAEDQRPRGCLRASFRGFGWGSCHRWPLGPEHHDEVVDEQPACPANSGGCTVKISTDDGVMVGTAKGMSNVTNTDIATSNGVIQVIDALILPE